MGAWVHEVPINLTLQSLALSRINLREDAMEVHTRRCNGMSFMRTKAEDLTFLAPYVIEIN
jgi:hypothetical protein